MLSRRVFLLSAFAVPGLSLLQRAAIGAELASAKVLVLSENTCADTTIFAACLPSTCIETDPSSVLLELDSSFRKREYELVFGLTRDSNYVLIEQYAQAAAYQLCYHAIHKYDANGLTHSIRAEKEVSRQISKMIAEDKGEWTRVISQVPALSNYQDPLMVSEILNTKHNCPSQSPGHLVSWLFRRTRA